MTTSLTKHSIRPSADDIREFAEAVRKVNKAFVDQTMPGFLILNCVAKRPVKLTDDDGTSFKALVGNDVGQSQGRCTVADKDSRLCPRAAVKSTLSTSGPYWWTATTSS